jgi:hypothetical protein
MRYLALRNVYEIVSDIYVKTSLGTLDQDQYGVKVFHVLSAPHLADARKYGSNASSAVGTNRDEESNSFPSILIYLPIG